MSLFETIVYAFFVGLLPALFWLWFWLHEDSAHPEPRSTLAFTFTTGMAMIFLAIPLEALFNHATLTTSWRFLAWAGVEEVLKFSAAYLAALHTKAYDEPLDAIVYMMCAALGFAALENMLFILNNGASIALGTSAGALSTVFITNLRFIGANLLHVVASSTIGIAMALSFYKKIEEKVVWTIGGIAVAIILHTLFNLFIIDGSGSGIFLVFSTVWLTMIGFILVFEKIKKMSVPSTQQITRQ
jgi:RsiW-degrading membrane proteinase PrsW (M82 family)